MTISQVPFETDGPDIGDGQNMGYSDVMSGDYNPMI